MYQIAILHLNILQLFLVFYFHFNFLALLLFWLIFIFSIFSLIIHWRTVLGCALRGAYSSASSFRWLSFYLAVEYVLWVVLGSLSVFLRTVVLLPQLYIQPPLSMVVLDPIRLNIIFLYSLFSHFSSK